MITTKSTKAEILDAYEALKEKFEQQSEQSPADEKVKKTVIEEEKKTVEKASSYSVENIVKSLAEINLHINNSLNDLSEKLKLESSKLSELKRAIEIEEKHLEEVRDIKIAADTLSLLIQEYETRKKEFEQEASEREKNFELQVKQKRDEWEKEQAVHESMVKERNEKIFTERKRESEEYEYNLTLARKKDKDAYEQKRASLERELEEKRISYEKEFSQREAYLSERESELEDLRNRVTAFDSLKEEAVRKAEESSTKEAEHRAKVKMDLFVKEKEGEIKLLEQKNSNLKELVEKQALQIEELSRQLADANNQVLSIATKAIEGASGAKTLNTVQEIAMEQARRANAQKS
jgi:hypothetical protein